MKYARIYAFASILLPISYAQTPAAAPRPVSPEIHPDHSVTFRLLAPKANEVTLNGSWEGARDIKMTKDDSGVWSVKIAPLTRQLWGYWYLVDGVKALDPGNGETQRDGSRYDNLLMISGAESDALGLQGCSTRQPSHRLVPFADAEAGPSPHVRLHAARLRSEPDTLSGPVPSPRGRRR